jgi:long-chain acyl-CoA synthetase
LVQAIKPLSDSDVYFSYLPLEHLPERVSISAFLWYGSAIGFSSENRNVYGDIKTLSPTFLVGDPEFFECIIRNIHKHVADCGNIKRFLFYVATSLQKKLSESGRHYSYSHSFSQTSIFQGPMQRRST